MTHTITPAGRLTAALAAVLGPAWTQPTVRDWPVVFTHESDDSDLTVYPDRKHSRLVLELAPAGLDDFSHRRFATYTPDLCGHDTIDGWLAHGDLDTAADALALILGRLVDQPLPERPEPPITPLEREREQLARTARELSAHSTQFAAGLLWSLPVTEDARRLVALAKLTLRTATRVDELRGTRHH
ncbi:hypothetical protein ACIQNG_35490 [Streptomyces sp. NPDC091377]|uniref:hypothetical protein n=1 Tax=Streptomyces sp. NPDC091377 TaxID=3365995 RepID=UPI0038106F3D